MQKQVKVLINGKQYMLATDEQEHVVVKAATMLDDLISQTRQKSPNLSDEKVHLAAALHFATEFVKKETQGEDVDAALRRLISLLDAQI